MTGGIDCWGGLIFLTWNRSSSLRLTDCCKTLTWSHFTIGWCQDCTNLKMMHYHYQNLSLTVQCCLIPLQQCPPSLMQLLLLCSQCKGQASVHRFSLTPLRTGSSILSWKTVKEKSINKLPICCYNIND